MDLTSFMKEGVCSKVCSLLPLHSRGTVKQGPHTDPAGSHLKGFSAQRENLTPK